MRRAWFLALMTTACGGEALELGIADLPVCALDTSDVIRVSGRPQDAPRFVAGPAVVDSVSPLRVTIDGEAFELALEGPFDLSALQRYPVAHASMELATEGEGWTASRVSFYEDGLSGQRGRLVLSAWSGVRKNEGDLQAGEVGYTYRGAGCRVVNDCGTWLGGALFMAVGGEVAQVEPGEVQQVAGYNVYNGSTTHVVSNLACTDTPDRHYQGAIILDQPL